MPENSKQEICSAPFVLQQAKKHASKRIVVKASISFCRPTADIALLPARVIMASVRDAGFQNCQYVSDRKSVGK